MIAPQHPAHVLVVDDEVQMRRLLQRTLEAAGYRMTSAENGADALARARMDHPDIVVLDLGLPDMDGSRVLSELREWSSVPVLILSVRDAEQTIVDALDRGADDYLTKPFRTGELLARIRALLRYRASGREDQVVTVGDLLVDLARRSVLMSGVAIKLTPTEYSLLALFVRNAGKVLTHRYILHQVWGPSFEEETQYLRVFIRQLRKKIEKDPEKPQLLVTETGVGYRLMC